jgi:hypothetical protein
VAGRKALDMLEARADRLIAQHAPDPISAAIETMALADIQRLTALHDTHGPAAMLAAFQEIAQI